MTVDAFPACSFSLGITPSLWSTAVSIFNDSACLARAVANVIPFKAIKFGVGIWYQNSATQQSVSFFPISFLVRCPIPHGCRAQLNQRAICHRSTICLRSASSQHEPSIRCHNTKPPCQISSGTPKENGRTASGPIQLSITKMNEP